jgi:glycosyltransferase involved in cell wall biosynthesis
MWRVLTDEEQRASLIDKGLKRARMFSWERAAKETLDVYRRVVG